VEAISVRVRTSPMRYTPAGQCGRACSVIVIRQVAPLDVAATDEAAAAAAAAAAAGHVTT